MMFMYLPWILWSFTSKFDFYGLPSPWERFNLVQIEISSTLPQDLCQMAEYCLKTGSHTCEK